MVLNTALCHTSANTVGSISPRRFAESVVLSMARERRLPCVGLEGGECAVRRLHCGDIVHHGLLRSFASAKTLQAALHGLAFPLFFKVDAVPH